MSGAVRVVVTRALVGQQDELSDRLRAAGLEVVECPLVRIEPLTTGSIAVDGFDWVVLTSRIAVHELLRRVGTPLPRVAVIGPGTAEALRAQGVEPALVACPSTQEGLLEALPRPAGRVLFAGAEGARDLLARELDAVVVSLYRTVEAPPVELPEADLVVLASGSAARSLAVVRTDLPCVSIGPSTSAEARSAGLDVVAEAASHDLEGLVQAVKLAASRIASSRS